MKTILLILLFFVRFSLFGQDITTFILVRHAEKVMDDTRNPPLSEEGLLRAQKLALLLGQTAITAIYSTNLERTVKTVAPLAGRLDLKVQFYDWDDPEALVIRLMEENKGGTLLISGHSNTTPILANLLLREEYFEQFDDADYGNLLIIEVPDSGVGKLIHLTY